MDREYLLDAKLLEHTQVLALSELEVVWLIHNTVVFIAKNITSSETSEISIIESAKTKSNVCQFFLW